MRKLKYFLLILPFLFISNVNALTQCGSQGIEYDNKTMPLIVFLGNAASSGYEIQNYAFSDSSQSALNWSFNSFQQLCAKGSGSLPSTFSYITFRVSNYTFLKGNIYTIVFSFTDTNSAWNIQPASAVNQNFNWAKILSSKADPRDKVMYLTVVFEVIENYSGTSNFVFYADPINTSDFVGLTEYFYTPYITSVPVVPDNSSKFENIQQIQQNTLSAVQTVQGQVNQVESQLNNIDGTLKDDNIDTSKTSIEDKSADASNSPISSLLTLPLKLLNNINTGLSGTCSSFNLGSLFGTDLILPCINLEQRLGTFLWGLIDSFFCIFLIYNVGMLAIKIWTDVIMMKDFFSDLYKPSGEKGGKKE